MILFSSLHLDPEAALILLSNQGGWTNSSMVTWDFLTCAWETASELRLFPGKLWFSGVCVCIYLCTCTLWSTGWNTLTWGWADVWHWDDFTFRLSHVFVLLSVMSVIVTWSRSFGLTLSSQRISDNLSLISALSYAVVWSVLVSAFELCLYTAAAL